MRKKISNQIISIENIVFIFCISFLLILLFNTFMNSNIGSNILNKSSCNCENKNECKKTLFLESNNYTSNKVII